MLTGSKYCRLTFILIIKLITIKKKKENHLLTLTYVLYNNTAIIHEQDLFNI